jgi:hypothetical protein
MSTTDQKITVTIHLWNGGTNIVSLPPLQMDTANYSRLASDFIEFTKNPASQEHKRKSYSIETLPDGFTVRYLLIDFGAVAAIS